jgi:hypothetical protein
MYFVGSNVYTCSIILDAEIHFEHVNSIQPVITNTLSKFKRKNWNTKHIYEEKYGGLY